MAVGLLVVGGKYQLNLYQSIASVGRQMSVEQLRNLGGDL